MGEISLGASLVIIAVVLNCLVAYFESAGDTVSGEAIGGGCTTSNNETSCQNVSKTTFLSALLHVTVHGVDGLGLFSTLYAIISGSSIVLGVILFVHGIAANLI